MEQYLTLLSSSNFIIDAVLAICFLLAFILGYKKGLYRCVAPLVITVFSAAASIFGSRFLVDPVTKVVYPIFSEELNKKIEIAFSNVSEKSAILDKLLKNVDLSQETDKITEAVTKNAVHFLLLIVCFLVALIIFNLIGKIFERIVSISLVTTFDGILGAIFGLLCCFVIIYLIIKFADLANFDFFEKTSPKPIFCNG